jgi:predicted aldo/keto reductase-like oxidoreductase
MIYRELGGTGINISIIGFGGMRFFSKDEATAAATVQRCLEKGITFFETGSYGNGKSEEWLGNALWQACRREDVVLADKVPACDMPRADQVRAGLEAALTEE